MRPEEMGPVSEEKENAHKENNPSKKSKMNTFKENAISISDGTYRLKAQKEGIQPEKLEPALEGKQPKEIEYAHEGKLHEEIERFDEKNQHEVVKPFHAQKKGKKTNKENVITISSGAFADKICKKYLKPFECAVCKMQFSAKQTLMRHAKKHCKEKQAADIQRFHQGKKLEKIEPIHEGKQPKEMKPTDEKTESFYKT